MVLAAGRPAVAMAFTADPAVLAVLAGFYPWVFATQPVNALAFVWDGILYGANGCVLPLYSNSLHLHRTCTADIFYTLGKAIHFV